MSTGWARQKRILIHFGNIYSTFNRNLACVFFGSTRIYCHSHDVLEYDSKQNWPFGMWITILIGHIVKNAFPAWIHLLIQWFWLISAYGEAFLSNMLCEVGDDWNSIILWQFWCCRTEIDKRVTVQRDYVILLHDFGFWIIYECLAAYVAIS